LDYFDEWLPACAGMTDFFVTERYNKKICWNNKLSYTSKFSFKGQPMQNDSLHLPLYQDVVDKIGEMHLPISCSELHGVLTGLLCAGALPEAESYVRSFIIEENTTAKLALFDIFTITRQQLSTFDFHFEMLLPGTHAEISERAQAFSEWCTGFLQGMNMADANIEDCDEETQEVLEHLKQFSELDYQTLDAEENNEKDLMELQEFAKIAVLRLYYEFSLPKKDEQLNNLH
jgi:uncharacterized protein